MTNTQPVNKENKKENNQSFNPPNWGLSSALGLLAPESNSSNKEQQIPMKRKTKKPKRGFKR